MPLLVHVELLSVAKPELFTPLTGNVPRKYPHLVVLFGEMAVQPSGTGIQSSCPAVEGSTRKSCAGVPTCTSKVFQSPSLPSQKEDGAHDMGAGMLLAAIAAECLKMAGARSMLTIAAPSLTTSQAMFSGFYGVPVLPALTTRMFSMEVWS